MSRPRGYAILADMKPSLEAKQMDQPRPVVTQVLRAFEHGKESGLPRQDYCSAEHLGCTANVEKPDSATRSRNGKEVESRVAVAWKTVETVEKGRTYDSRS